jgi:hypothetical protein
VEEERIKSAFEIAMERISALPELTPEEIAAQKEKQYSPIGEAIAGKYLNGFISEDEIADEAEKCQGEQKQIVMRALVSSLCRAMHIGGGPDSVARALKGISRVAPGKAPLIEKAGEDFRSILGEFEQEKQMRSVEFQEAAAKKMRELGISGAAVRPNLNENEAWQNELGKLRQAYESRLSVLRGSVLQEVSSQNSEVRIQK